MGAICPNGHGIQPIVKNITADLDVPKKASDVIAVVLKCGCKVGGEKYKAYAESIQDIKRKEAAEVAAVTKKYANQKAVALKAFITEEGN